MMRIAALWAAILITPAQAQALPPLHENPTVVNGFYAIGLADEVRKNCENIHPRLFRAYRFLKSLERFALKTGYTEAQIDELVDDRSKRRELRVRIRKDLASRGASPQSPEGYCAVGQEEIAKDSMAGRLLRAN